MRRLLLLGVAANTAFLVLPLGTAASSPASDVRLTNDCHPLAGCGAGYVSAYTLATGISYTDPVLDTCTTARGQNNEPAVAVDPRDASVLVGSSNDYCGLYSRVTSTGIALGPTWLGYDRSLNGGAAWTSSLVPGYPGDASPYAALSEARTEDAGDPVIAWDAHGRAFFGSESHGDPTGTAKTFGDVWVARFRNPGGPDASDTAKDGLEYYGTTVAAQGSSAPDLLGKFHDKTAIEVDRTGGRCDGNVYFGWSRFNGDGANEIYFVRSTDHGVTFSNPMRVEQSLKSVHFADISVTEDGDVYVTFRTFASVGPSTDAIYIAKSRDCGKTFGAAQQITTFTPNDAQDQRAAEPVPVASQPERPELGVESDSTSDRARDCGDSADGCASGYTFFRRDTQVRSTADQSDASRQWVYVVYDATKPGTEAPTGSTYGTDGPGVGGQAGTYFLRYDGATGAHSTPVLIDDQPAGHQVLPDISADGGVVHAIWWDSRNDPCYSVTRPIGNCANKASVPSLDVYGARSTDGGTTWAAKTRISDLTTNPNDEQFDNRQVPFAGDYLWVTSLGNFAYTAWTDWRNSLPGTDPRESTEDEDAATSDVHQCRSLLESTDKKGNVTDSWSRDLCPHDGGIDQNVYGDSAP